jgi:hypothetical protein
VKRVPEPDLPLPRASLPEGCSDLVDAYKIRAAAEDKHQKFLLRTAALLHDPFVAQLGPKAQWMHNEWFLRKRISDFLHPILLANPELENQIGSSSDLVETLFHVVMANAEDGES